MPDPVASQQAGSAAMEVTTQKSDLLKERSVTQGIVERKSTIPILTTFLFEATDNNLLITATDLDLSLRTFQLSVHRSARAELMGVRIPFLSRWCRKPPWTELSYISA